MGCFLFAINLTGCSYKSERHGVNIESNALTQVRTKLAESNLTVSELTNLLGPYSAIYVVDGKFSILYISFTRTSPPIKRDYISELKIYEFIADATSVTTLNEYDDSALRQLALNKNQISHETKKFSILKQMFGNIGRITGTNNE